MIHRASIPLQVTVSGKVLFGHASPMFENGYFTVNLNGVLMDFARTYQIYFRTHRKDTASSYYGYMMYNEVTGWRWVPQKDGDLPEAGDQIAAIIEAWYG